MSAKKLSNVRDIASLKNNNLYIIILIITYIAYKNKLNIWFQLNVFRLVIMVKVYETNNNNKLFTTRIKISIDRSFVRKVCFK